MDLQPAHTHARPRRKPARYGGCRQQLKLFTFGDLSGNQCPGDHGAESAHRKRTIDGQARDELGRTRRDLQTDFAQSAFQLFNSFTSARADGDDGCVF